MLRPGAGVTVYPLSIDAVPYGIATDGTSTWATDLGTAGKRTQRLLRLVEGARTYLPVVAR